MSEAKYRRKLVEHNDACLAALAATSEPIRAYMRKRFRLDLYPLEFITDTIADLEALVQAQGSTTAVNAVDPVAETGTEGLRASDRPSVAVVVPPQEEAARDLLAYGEEEATNAVERQDRDQYQFWQGWNAALQRLVPHD